MNPNFNLFMGSVGSILAEGEGFEPPDTDQGVVRFQVECIQPDSANLPNDVFERIFEQSIAWFF